MAFNDKQKVVLIVGLVVIGFMCLFPPWKQSWRSPQYQIDHSLGYRFLAFPPAGGKIDFSRLGIQWLIVLSLTTVGMLIVADSKGKARGTEEIQPESEEEISDKEFIAFIGKRADKYLATFKKFREEGNDKFLLTWNWAAFIGNFWWALYRKLYGWALVMFILYFIPIVNLIFALIFGMSGNYIYYRLAKRKILKLGEDEREAPEILDTLRKKGGINGWVPVAAVFVIVTSLYWIIVAVSIPQYYKHYNSIARSALRHAVTAQEMYRIDHKTYARSINDLLASGDLYLPEGVHVKVISVSKKALVLLSFHENGNEAFVLKWPGGSILPVSQISIEAGQAGFIAAMVEYDLWRLEKGKLH